MCVCFAVLQFLHDLKILCTGVILNSLISDSKPCLCTCKLNLFHCASDRGGLYLQREPGPVGENSKGRGGGHRAQPAL